MDDKPLIDALEHIYARANRAAHTVDTMAPELRRELGTVALLARTAIERAVLAAPADHSDLETGGLSVFQPDEGTLADELDAVEKSMPTAHREAK